MGDPQTHRPCIIGGGYGEKNNKPQTIVILSSDKKYGILYRFFIDSLCIGLSLAIRKRETDIGGRVIP